MPDDVENAGKGVAPSGCPVAEWYDPLDGPAHPDPFPWYRQLRQQGRVVYVPEYDWYVVTRHKEILDVLRDAVTYSNAASLGDVEAVPPEIVEEAGEDWSFAIRHALVLNDPPKHTRLRKLLAPSFTPRRIGQFESLVREIAEVRIEAIADRGKGDLGLDFAFHIPNRIIARILGADEEAADRFVDWSDGFAAAFLADVARDQKLWGWRQLMEQDAYTRNLIEARRRCPANDLTSDMINARTDDGGAALSDEEIVSSTMGLMTAGSESSSVMMLHTMYFLLSHPQQWEEVRADPSLVPKAIEEMLRLRGPVRGLFRVAMEDVELGGVSIPKGAHIYLHLASANNDEDVFEEPERFDIHRPNLNDHIGFGRWAHFCIGAPLARLEGRVAIETLIDLLPNLRLAPDFDHRLEYDSNPTIHLAKSLPVEWD